MAQAFAGAQIHLSFLFWRGMRKVLEIYVCTYQANDKHAQTANDNCQME